MPISVECPACEHEFRVPNSYGGKQGKCPECGKVFVTPTAGSADLRSTPRAQPPPRSAASRNGRRLPVPPPQQLAGRYDNTAVSDPPAAIDGAPPVVESAVHVSPPAASPRAKQDNTQRTQLARRSRNGPLWIALGVLAAMLVVCVIVVVKNMRLAGKEVAGDAEIRMRQEEARPVGDAAEPVDESGPLEAAAIAATLQDVQRQQMWDRTRPAVFRLAVHRDGESRTGLAFAVDERGRLATSYQLIEGAQSVEITAAGNSSAASVPALGVIASNPERNVAIIAIEQKPDATLNLDATMPSAGEDLAVCRSQATDGFELAQAQFLHLKSLESLTPNSRAIAHQHGLARDADTVWLEHDVPLALEDRGGPLLNAEGNVVGINTSLSPESKTGFALPAAYLIELVESASDELTPFAESATALAGNNAATATSSPEPEDAAASIARPEPGTLESVDAIRELHKTCKEIDWLPATVGEYELFQDLAEYIHVAKVNESDEMIEEGLRILIAAAAQDVLVDLSERPWPEEVDLVSLNAFAAESLEDESRGVFCYVELISTTRDTDAIGDTAAILCKLIGTDQLVALPVKNESRLLTQSSRWLLIGLHDPVQTLAMRGDDGAEIAVPVIRAKNLLAEPAIVTEEKPRRSPRGRR